MVSDLKKIQSALEGDKYLSAQEIAKKLNVSLPTVYRQIKALEERGATIAAVSEARSRPGPRPVKYRVVRGADL